MKTGIARIGSTGLHKMKKHIAVTCPAKIGDLLRDVETPALIVDRKALHRNLQRMADYMRTINKEKTYYLRPHAKTHKCPSLAKLQIDNYGAVGICC